jgi:xylulokinase
MRDMSEGGSDVYIGLDLGTSGLKGVALTPGGAVIARGSAAYPTRRPVPGACEQAPQTWIAAVESVAAQLRSAAPPERWRGIGLSAMIPTLVTAQPGGEPAGPAVTWQDSRADPHGEQLRERCGGERLYKITGQWLDGRYLLPMFLRVAGDEPARAAGVTWLLAAKDYLFGWLTGEIATDPSTATGFGCYRLEAGAWDGDVIAAAAALAGPAVPALPSLPPVLPATTCWPLRAETARRLGCARIPVCLGAADSVLGAFGLGVRDRGQVAYVAGTSTVIMGVADRLLLDPGHRFLVTPLAEPGRWGLEMDLLATGGAISWLAGLLGTGTDEAALVALAAGVDPRDAPLVLPYLSPGEQGALWDPLLRGAFVGLELRHGRRHLARGLVNGIVLESRRCLTVLDDTRLFGRELRVAGSSAANDAFRADLADATRRRVGMPGEHGAASSARGAALLAALAIGGVRPAPAIAPAGAGQEPAPPVAEPDPGRAALWDELWASYEQARHAVSQHYHAGPPHRSAKPDAPARGDGLPS